MMYGMASSLGLSPSSCFVAGSAKNGKLALSLVGIRPQRSDGSGFITTKAKDGETRFGSKSSNIFILEGTIILSNANRCLEQFQ